MKVLKLKFDDEVLEFEIGKITEEKVKKIMIEQRRNPQATVVNIELIDYGDLDHYLEDIKSLPKTGWVTGAVRYGGYEFKASVKLGEDNIEKLIIEDEIKVVYIADRNEEWLSLGEKVDVLNWIESIWKI